MILINGLISVSVAWLTFRLIKAPQVSPTRASSFISLVFFLILFIVSKKYYFDVYHYSFLIFGASFVGMSSYKIISDQEVILGGIIFTFTYSYLIGYFTDIGGGLGFCAFISIMISRLLTKSKFSIKR